MSTGRTGNGAEKTAGIGGDPDRYRQGKVRRWRCPSVATRMVLVNGCCAFLFPHWASGFSNRQKPDAQRKGKDEEEKKGVAVAISDPTPSPRSDSR